MLQALQRKMRDREDGFTLIELMVVVLIIAILLAIAIPTFLGARQRAQDRAAQSDLRNALTAAKVLYTDTESYSLTASDLMGVEPSLTFVAVASTTADNIGFVGSAANIDFVTLSEAGDYFCLAEDEAAGVSSGSAATLAEVDTFAECDALTNEWAG